MAFQPQAEKEAERELIKRLVASLNSQNTFGGGEAKILRLQGDDDDGKVDGVIEISLYDPTRRIELGVEARRKGYPNHRGEVCRFSQGWKTPFLKNGIYLNEITIRNHQEKGFLYVVDIKGAETKFAFIKPELVGELLSQPYKPSISTNSGVTQSVKSVPLEWFKYSVKGA